MDHIRMLSGNLAGQMLAVPREVRQDEAEINVATGVAEWCESPVVGEEEPEMFEPRQSNMAGVETAATRTAPAAPASGRGQQAEARDIRHLGGGWYEFADGSRQQLSREEAEARGYRAEED